MLKRFFVALILGLLVLSSQLAAAEYDWSKAPRIGSKAELVRYIENGRCEGQMEFYFTYPNAKINNQAELVKFVDDISYWAVVPAENNGIFSAHITEVGGYGSGRFIYKITKEYPGTRVANAYLSSNQHQAWMNLTNEEQKLYNIAVDIVDKANKHSTELEKARYIHDEICKRVKEWKSHSNEDAIGALVVKVTNCQGFADAFYMLGRMCGLDVVRIGGTFQGESHAWNFITFSDGKTYCVDVTGTFNSKSSMELLTFETMKPRYSCEWEIIPNLQRN